MSQWPILRRWPGLLAVAVTTLFVLAACTSGDGGSSPPQSARDGGDIVVHAGEPQSLDPHFSAAEIDLTIEQMIYRGLYDLLPDGTLRPAYADGLPQISDDGLVYTIAIKSGMQWGNGEVLDARDFVFGIQRTCNPDVAGFFQYILTNIGGCDDYYFATEASADEKAGLLNLVTVSAPDNLTLELRLGNPQPTFSTLLALLPAYPAPDETLASVDAAWPSAADTPCNGPFCVTELVSGDHLTLGRNPNWALGPAASLDTITLRFIDDFSVALRAYQSGELDLVRVGEQDLPLVRDRSDFLSQQLPSTIGLVYNLADDLLANDSLRLALSRAIDRILYAEVVFNNGVIATTNWIPAEEPGANLPGIFDGTIGFDLAAAKAALDEAGYPNGDGFPGVTLLAVDNATTRTEAEFLQNAFRENLGIDIAIDLVDGRTFGGRLFEGDFQLALSGWVHDYPDAENWLNGLFNTGAPINFQGCSNADIDAALDAAQFEQDQATRFALLQEAERLAVTTLCGYAPLYHEGNFYLINPDLLGVQPTLADHFLPQFPEMWGLAAD